VVNEDVEGWSRERKAALCAGADTWHTFDVPELGLPALRVSDGPNGVRGHVFDGDPSVCFPVASALAATWNLSLIEEVGRALASECRRKGAGVLLAPTVNLHRHPLAGRNFEAFSEDPYLTSRLAVAYIEGLQRSGVGGCVKHFAGNESEYQRHTMSSEIDERTLREAYLRPFEAAVREAGVWSLMSSYNRLNGTPASDHDWLLTTVLRDQWGFTGAVLSDWGGTRSTAEALRAGVDLEMPGPTQRRGAKLVEAVETGEVPEVALTAAASNVVRLIARTAQAGVPDVAVDADEVAYRAALQGLVLLRNDDVLPLPSGAALAVIGANAEPGEIQGGGSARVTPASQVSPLAGLRAHPGAAAVEYAMGCRVGKHCVPLAAPRVEFDAEPGARLELFDELGCTGAPVAVRHVRSMSQHFYGHVAGVADSRRFSARCTGTFSAEADGVHRFGLACAGSARLLVDGAVIATASAADGAGATIYGWGSDETVVPVELAAGRRVDVVVEFDRDTDSPLGGTLVGVTPPDPPDLFERAVAAAAAADVAVVVVGLDGHWETEGRDRESLHLPGRQDQLVHAVATVNQRTVVVVNAGSPVAMPWVDDAAAIVHASYPGQAFGQALATVLFGDEPPVGKLATTWPRRIEDCPAYTSYPGEDGRVVYREGLHLGHRHFDRAGIEPLFPFGHGLGYTTFDYGDPVLEPAAPGAVAILVPVTNSGDRRGVEVAQLYISYPQSAVDRPARELRGFDRIELEPGETRLARFELCAEDLAHWDVGARRWVTERTPMRAFVGASSRDLRTEITVDFADGAPAGVPAAHQPQPSAADRAAVHPKGEPT